MATTSSHEFGMAKWKAYQSLEQSVKVTTTGSDCYNYGLLASGYIDIVAERLTAPHDYLPLINIVQGAGGVITDWDGNKLGFDAKNVYVLASASKDLHKLALNKLTGTLPKSLGNLVFVSDLRKRIDPRAIRVALMAHHYRTDFEWFDEEGPKAQADLELLLEATSAAAPVFEGSLIAEVREALDNDLDAPTAREILLDRARTLSKTSDLEARGELIAAARLCGIAL